MNRHMELLFDSLKEGLFIVATTGRILYANPAARAALPIVIGEPLPAEWLQHQITAIRKKYLTPPLSFEMDLQGDSAHPDQTLITLLPSPTGSDLIVLMKNITAENLYENAIGNLAEMLDSEFRTPMKQFRAAVGEMLAQFEKHAGDNWLLKGAADKVTRKGDSLEGLLDKIGLLAAAYQSFRMRGEERIPLRSLVDDALLAAAPLIAERRIQVSFCGLDGSPLVVYGGRKFLAQALAGYLRDLAQRIDRGSNILISAMPKGNYVLLTVIDYGEVIPTGTRKATTPRMGTTHSKFFEATDLTLSLCKRVVEMNGGSLRIDREKGRARSVTFELPVGAPATGSRELMLEQACRYAEDLKGLLQRQGTTFRADQDHQRSTRL